MRANGINCLLYKVLPNLHNFPVLNKNCTEPYPVRCIEGIANNYASSPNGLSASWAMDSEGHECERNNCCNKIQLVGQTHGEKTTLADKTRFSCHCFCFQSRRFSLLVGYNMRISSSTNQIATLITDHQLDFTKIYFFILIKIIIQFFECKSLKEFSSPEQYQYAGGLKRFTPVWS